jgi:hypothetical protein
MADHTVTSELLQKILADALSPDDERAALEALVKSQPQTALSLLPAYVLQKARYRAELEACRKEAQQLGALLKDTPWMPATVIHVLGADLFPGEPPRALVAAEGRWLVVGVGPGIDPTRLGCGTSALLNNRSSVLVGLAGPLPRPGSLATFSRFHDGLAVILGPGDEEIAVAVTDSVRSAGTRAWVQQVQATCQAYERNRGRRPIQLPGCGVVTGPISASTVRCRAGRCVPCMEPNDGSPLYCHPPAPRSP